MNIIEKVRSFVEEECLKPESRYGYEPFKYHFSSVVRYAEKLADELGADKEVVVISGWLHDIGSIIHGREDHHITGAEIAVKKLREFEYPEEKIELVRKCILNHRGSEKIPGESLEEKIIAEADALSAFDNIAGVFKAALVYEGKEQGEARESVKQKLMNKWEQLRIGASKEMIRPRFEAAMLLLADGNNELE